MCVSNYNVCVELQCSTSSISMKENDLYSTVRDKHIFRFWVLKR